MSGSPKGIRRLGGWLQDWLRREKVPKFRTREDYEQWKAAQHAQRVAPLPQAREQAQSRRRTIITDPQDSYQEPVESGDGRRPQPEFDCYAIATAQRLLCITILIVILSLVAVAILSQASQSVVLIIPLILVVVGVLQIVAIYELGSGVYNSKIIGVVVAILASVPVLGLLALLIGNHRATKILRSNGYRVGVLGAKLSQFQ